MADIGAVAAGIKTRLLTISGLRAHDKIVSDISPPAAIVKLDNVEFDIAMGRGSDLLTFLVRVFASASSDRAAQNLLYDYLDGTGATSIKTAIEGDVTLGGTAASVRVTDARNFDAYEVAGVDYLGVEFVVEVQT